jgi:2-polyprenyl-3-methyl-5-hydroxy-6-metoxy-1,4-benzoquinol methylase
LGFAVGQEPLPDYFSSLGVQVTATDLETSEGVAKGWATANELAFDKQTLYRGISRREQFERNVRFRAADMNAISQDLREFDFCWSACALEHLGSIEAGKRFLAASLETLRPGGLSVHTTEFNVKSDRKTADNRGTVIFRKRDLREIAAQLRDAGHMVAPLNFHCGSHRLDRYVDLPPYRDDCHLKLELSKFAATSFGIAIQKRPAGGAPSIC